MKTCDFAVGDTVWMVHHSHSYDRYINNQFWSISRKVIAVVGDILWLEHEGRVSARRCFRTEEECKMACPEDHEDP